MLAPYSFRFERSYSFTLSRTFGLTTRHLEVSTVSRVLEMIHAVSFRRLVLVRKIFTCLRAKGWYLTFGDALRLVLDVLLHTDVRLTFTDCQRELDAFASFHFQFDSVVHFTVCTK